jgi:hypothetical protein
MRIVLVEIALSAILPHSIFSNEILCNENVRSRTVKEKQSHSVCPTLRSCTSGTLHADFLLKGE